MTLRSRPVRRLSIADWRLFLQAVAYCVVVRIALWVVPSRAILRFVNGRVEATTARRRPRRTSVDRIAWAVRAAGRRVPRSTCLVNALAVQLLLARHGHGSELRIGVARDADRKFNAHAWVEVDGRIVVGASRDMQFTPLPDLARILG